MLLGAILLIGQLFAQENRQAYSNVELFITEPGRSYSESFEIYKKGKNFQSPFRKLNFVLVKYKDLDNDSVMYGVRLFCIHNYPSSSNSSPNYKILNSVFDIGEIESLISWIKLAQGKVPEIIENQTISYVLEKGPLMFGVFKERKKVYFRITFNKYDFSSAIFFNISVLDSFLVFLEEVQSKI